MAKIMVVDDAAFMRMMLSNMLTKMGHEVVAEADNGKTAVETYEKNRPDVVTMDIHMGGMDGFEATRRIMESDAPRPVVIVSSCWDPLEVEKTFQAMDAGAVAILPKPADIASGSEEYERELLETIASVAQKPILIHSVDGPVGVASRDFSTARISGIGWAPRHSLRDGIAKLYPWIVEQVTAAGLLAEEV